MKQDIQMKEMTDGVLKLLQDYADKKEAQEEPEVVPEAAIEKKEKKTHAEELAE